MKCPECGSVLNGSVCSKCSSDLKSNELLTNEDDSKNLNVSITMDLSDDDMKDRKTEKSQKKIREQPPKGNCIPRYNSQRRSEASAASDLINCIGTVHYSEKCEKRIKEARNAYNRLSEAQKKHVSNYSVLTSAESVYDRLRILRLELGLGMNAFYALCMGLLYLHKVDMFGDIWESLIGCLLWYGMPYLLTLIEWRVICEDSESLFVSICFLLCACASLMLWLAPYLTRVIFGYHMDLSVLAFFTALFLACFSTTLALILREYVYNYHYGIFCAVMSASLFLVPLSYINNWF